LSNLSQLKNGFQSVFINYLGYITDNMKHSKLGWYQKMKSLCRCE